MAMTKAERAAMDELRSQLALERAWRRTEDVERDLPPPTGDGLSRGWDFNGHSQTVYKACSSSVHHGHGWERTTSQGSRWLYSTEERAWRALRYAVEQKALKDLARIDAATPTTPEPTQ